MNAAVLAGNAGEGIHGLIAALARKGTVDRGHAILQIVCVFAENELVAVAEFESVRIGKWSEFTIVEQNGRPVASLADASEDFS